MKRLRELNPALSDSYVWHVQGYHVITLRGWVCGGQEVSHGALILHHAQEVDENGKLSVLKSDRIILGLTDSFWRINYVGNSE